MIKFKLTKFEKSLAFQITEMSAENINTNSDTDMHISINNVNVISSSSPDIEVNNQGEVTDLFLWGRATDENLSIITPIFKSNKQRDDAYDLIISTLKQWAQSGGFKKKPKRADRRAPRESFSF